MNSHSDYSTQIFIINALKLLLIVNLKRPSCPQLTYQLFHLLFSKRIANKGYNNTSIPLTNTGAIRLHGITGFALCWDAKSLTVDVLAVLTASGTRCMWTHTLRHNNSHQCYSNSNLGKLYFCCKINSFNDLISCKCLSPAQPDLSLFTMQPVIQLSHLPASLVPQLVHLEESAQALTHKKSSLYIPTSMHGQRNKKLQCNGERQQSLRCEEESIMPSVNDISNQLKYIILVSFNNLPPLILHLNIMQPWKPFFFHLNIVQPQQRLFFRFCIVQPFTIFLSSKHCAVT